MDFTDYMNELGQASRVKLSALPRLSELTGDQEKEFAAAWPGIEVRRRRRIISELTDLAEDNVELNFDTVFRHGLSDDDAAVRRASIRGLWEYDRPDIIDPLLRILDSDPDAGVRVEAALALGRFVLLSEEGRLSERSGRLVEAGLRRAIERTDEEVEVRARALEAVGAHNEAWVRQAISKAYESDIPRMKVSAVHAMGRSCEARWLPLVSKQLSNEDAEVRYEAAVACGSLGEEQAIPDLIRLVVDPDDEVRQAAIGALGEIGGRQAKDALATLLGSQSESTREAARDALTGLEFEEDPLSFKFRP